MTEAFTTYETQAHINGKDYVMFAEIGVRSTILTCGETVVEVDSHEFTDHEGTRVEDQTIRRALKRELNWQVEKNADELIRRAT